MDEILVHISAPTTRQNDDLYRSLTDAYLNFEPYQRTRVKELENSDSRGGSNPTNMDIMLPSDEGNSSHAVDIPPSNASKDSYGSFPSLDRSNTQYSFEQSVEPDSILSANRLGQLERIQINWRHQTDVRASALREQRSNIRSSISSGNLDTTFIEDSQLAAQAIESQLYDNGSSTSEDTSEDVSVKNTHPAPLSPGKSEELSPTSQTSTTSRRTNSDSNSGIEKGSTLHSSQVGVSLATTGNRDGIRDSHILPGSLDFSELPFEVFGPAPTISIESPGSLPSQITTHLNVVKLQNPNRFKPSDKFRTLEADERGYWLIESANWPKKIQYDFWLTLCEHVHDGRFGWGVTMYRDPSSISATPQVADELGPVRLYSWGEVVEHIWLSLWLCSKGKIVGSGSRWLDAEDNVIIRVP